MADLVIRGMEMPPEGEYHMTLYVCNDGYAYFDVDTFQVDEDRFEAVPLPKGHGRLIDADALCAGLVSNNPVVIYVKNAPTIVPAEGVNADG